MRAILMNLRFLLGLTPRSFVNWRKPVLLCNGPRLAVVPPMCLCERTLPTH